ncbi:phage tail tube protein [Acinetobacter sp. HY1485]|uniref:phage tail tube protein n=1 Tax=Acinetobacter sp. HY1485 TaxID=2970918 RepID=UPI0022B98E63|nr:phage tail tube protein [Acinetobacter sp. HY1485]
MSQIRVQGSRVYAVVGAVVERLQCLKTIDFGSDSTGKMEITCLDESDTKSYLPGLTDPGDGSMGFDFNKANESHLKVIDWAQKKTEVTLIMAEPGNDTDIPKVENGEIKLPTNRTFWKCVGTLSSPAWKFEADTLVNCTVTLQRKTALVCIPATT